MHKDTLTSDYIEERKHLLKSQKKEFHRTWRLWRELLGLKPTTEGGIKKQLSIFDAHGEEKSHCEP